MDWYKSMAYCIENDIKVYPVNVVGGFMIEICIRGRASRQNGIIKARDIDKKMKEHYVECAKVEINRMKKTA